MVSVVRDFPDGKWPFGGEGEPDDVPTPTGAACLKISEILALADEHAGEYSFGGQADMLPSAPALYINNVGMISLSLVKEQAEKLIGECEKSPFGHNMETKMDESVRKSWQLQPDQVQFQNPQWEIGIKELTKIIAGRLCYKDVPMECKLYKLLVYGEGGHFLKHQDTEKEDGMVATLVIQLPSVHEGGDLVVYRCDEEQHRYDFGKADGTAAFLPHYAVHYADAEHALETVTKGYRLALVYSVCLPATMRDLERDSNRTIADDLVEAINTMGPDGDSFALLLSHEYTKKSIGELGSAALKGIDNARFRALEKANAKANADKKLQFFIAKLSHKVDRQLEKNGWIDSGCKLGTHWYSIAGKDHGHSQDGGLSSKLNFLNPSHKTFKQRWNPHGSADDVYTGNEGPKKSTKYSRFAIVAWSVTKHLKYLLKFMPVEFVFEFLSNQRPVDAGTLREFFRFEEMSNGGTASMSLCRLICDLLIDAGEAELVTKFFNEICPVLGKRTGNSTLIPGLIKLISTFAWNEIREGVLKVLGVNTPGWIYNPSQIQGDSVMELTLRVVKGLDDAAALPLVSKAAFISVTNRNGTASRSARALNTIQRLDALTLSLIFALASTPVDVAIRQDLLKMAMEKDLNFRTSGSVGLLWKYIIRPGGSQALTEILDKLTKKDVKTLGPFFQVFNDRVHELKVNDETLTVLSSMTGKRIEWLKERIKQLDHLFSWEMPDAAEFPDYKEIDEFLHGPGQSLTTTHSPQFSCFNEARKFATSSMRDCQISSSFRMEPAGNSRKFFVKITKTREWFDNSRVNRSQRRIGAFDESLSQPLEKGPGRVSWWVGGRTSSTSQPTHVRRTIKPLSLFQGGCTRGLTL